VSDMIQGAPGAGMAPQGQAAQKPMMEQLRSPFNPADAALMAKRGQMSGTFGQYMESAFGVKWDDPLPQAGQKIMAKVKQGPVENKVQMMAGQPGEMPGGQPSGGRPPGNPGGGLDALMQRYNSGG